MNEQWKNINGYDGYQVSTTGRIKSPDHIYKRFSPQSNKIIEVPISGRLLKLGLRWSAYPCVRIHTKGVSRTLIVHQLVAKAFIPNPENKPHINHINGIKTDNRVENLEWVTPSENAKHAFRIGLKKPNRGIKCNMAILNDDKVREIRATYKWYEFGCAKLAAKYGVAETTIQDIIKRRTWRHI